MQGRNKEGRKVTVQTGVGGVNGVERRREEGWVGLNRINPLMVEQ